MTDKSGVSDPILAPITGRVPSSLKSSSAATLSLVSKAFPKPANSERIYAEKIDHRPLSLRPNDVLTALELRRRRRLAKLKKKRKPTPLSAKEKRELRIYDIPKSEVSYEKFSTLHSLWNEYISEIIPTTSHEPSNAFCGPTLLKADYHGALMTVEDCRCPTRKGISGICIKETKNMFEIVTKEDKLLKIPKEKTLFRVTGEIGRESKEKLEWRLWGDQFLVRSGERAGKKFNGRVIRGKHALQL